MSIDSWSWLFPFLVAAILIAGAVEMSRRLRAGRRRFDEVDGVAEMKGLEVLVLSGDEGLEVGLRRVYGDEDPSVTTFMTPADARLLAAWLRVAATSGVTLAIARARARDHAARARPQ